MDKMANPNPGKYFNRLDLAFPVVPNARSGCYKKYQTKEYSA
jgi:hypothetical protein